MTEEEEFIVGPWTISNASNRNDWTRLCAEDPQHGQNGRCGDFLRQELDAGRSTMDDIVESYCNSNPNIKECGCMRPPQTVVRHKDAMSKIYGNFECWYSPCASPYALMTLEMKRNSKGCKSCIFEPDDFHSSTRLPRCADERHEEQLFTPINIHKMNKQWDWLTIPLNIIR